MGKTALSKTLPTSDKVEDDPYPMTTAIESALTSHYDDFHRFLARRVPDDATAEDVLQSFCVRVMRRKVVLRNEETALGWLYKTLRSTLTDHYRREDARRRRDTRFAREQEVLNENSVETVLDPGTGTCSCVRGVLKDLREDYADILRLIDFKGQSHQQAATQLGISPANIRVRLHRARQAVAKALKNHCSGCCEDGYHDCYCSRACSDTEA